MRPYLKYLLLATTTLLFIVTFPLLPVASRQSVVGIEAQAHHHRPTTHLAQAQGNQDQGARANQLYEEALQLWQKIDTPHG